MSDRQKHRVVIVGGGFGGLNAAQRLNDKNIEVTLIDKRNFHLFQPLLYQVATGGLSSANIASPLRSILKKQKNARVIMTEVKDIDVENKQVLLHDESIEYDSLIVATGSKTSYFGHDEWEKCAPGLKSIEDAVDIRRRVLAAFEMAELEDDPQKVKDWLTFVVVGAGPTGVELAGSIAEISRSTLKNEFRNIDPRAARVMLIEGADRVLGSYPETLSIKAEKQLTKLGVEVVKDTKLSDICPECVTLQEGEREYKLRTHTVLWAAGITSSSLGKRLAKKTGTEYDRMGRVKVHDDCSLNDHPEIFVIGDLAHFADDEGHPLPGVAPVAIQQGRYAADIIHRRLKGKSGKPFKYKDYGSMATIGRSKAVAQVGWFGFSGYIAWAMWLFIHLMGLVQFSNRVLVLAQWTWNYWSFSRSARLITNDCFLPEQVGKRCSDDKDSKS